MPLRCLLSVVLLSLPILAKSPLESVQSTNTSQVEFTRGGTIRVLGSTGQLDVEGWDQPQVELTVIKSIYRGADSKDKAEGDRELGRIQVTTARKSDKELAISTSYPSRDLFHPLGGTRGVSLEYHIKVPRDSHLVIHHESGDVRLHDLTGEIDASSHEGDMLVLLPSTGNYAIDAQCKMGGVLSDFPGSHHTRHWTGEGFLGESAASATKVNLRVGVGGIQILKMPPLATPVRQ